MNDNKNENQESALKKAEDVLKDSGEVLEQTAKEGLQVAENAAYKVSETPPIKQAKNFWRDLGPGLTTGAADDDPSGIGTYSQSGARYGYQLLWLAPLTFPLMAIIQEMCARIGMVTGRGLAANIKKYYSRKVLYTVTILLLLANSFNIGADLGAMAKSTQLIFPGLPFWLLVVGFAAISLFLQIFISYQKYATYLKYLALILLVYVISAFVIKDFPWGEVLIETIVPSLNFSREQIILISGILGTTISPYLFFWETSQEVEEKISSGKVTIKARQEVDARQMKKMRLDVWTGMFFSNLVMFFIMAVCAATLFKNGIINIESAAEAASALKPLAGNYAFLLFALGIVGTGLLGIPILAGSASYAVSESFGWREGLYLRFRQGFYFYGVIIFSMLIGLGINFIGIDPIKALIYAAIANGLVAPLILIIIVMMANNKEIMNSHHNSRALKFIGWGIVSLMVVTGIATVISFF